MLKIGKEGKAKFYYYEGKISSKLPVFYNPKMVINRDITNLFINEINKKDEKIKKAVSLMAGTGVREIRWKKELSLKEIVANDLNKKAVELMKKNFELNNVEIKITQKDARFYEEKSDFIDLDPFGSPLPFLQPLIKGQYIKITATDLSVFCTYKKKSILKYKGFSRNKHFCHIEAIKILIKRVRDFFRMHELNVEPILSYYYEHHITVFLKKTRKWKRKGFKIFDYSFLKDLDIDFYKEAFQKKRIIDNEKSLKLIELIKEEAFEGFYYYLPFVYSKHKIKPIKIYKIIEKIKEEGFKASRSHFDSEIIKTELNKKEFLEILTELNSKNL